MKLSELLVDAWTVAPPRGGRSRRGPRGGARARVSAQGAVEASRAEKLARELFAGSSGGGHPGERAGRGRPRDARDPRRAGAWPSACPREPFRSGGRGPARSRGRRGSSCSSWSPVGSPGRGRTSCPAWPVAAGCAADASGSWRRRVRRGHPRRSGSSWRRRSTRGSLVEDALVPVRYRVYPDTPLGEVVDLMVRRGIHAVPVVGERYEVLGILTSGDALGHLLQDDRPRGGRRRRTRARRRSVPPGTS